MSIYARIRIAVAVNNLGEWSAAGWKLGSEPFDPTMARETAWVGLEEHPGDCAHLVWITAEIPVPKVNEVDALAVEVSAPEVET